MNHSVRSSSGLKAVESPCSNKDVANFHQASTLTRSSSSIPVMSPAPPLKEPPNMVVQIADFSLDFSISAKFHHASKYSNLSRKGLSSPIVAPVMHIISILQPLIVNIPSAICFVMDSLPSEALNKRALNTAGMSSRLQSHIQEASS